MIRILLADDHPIVCDGLTAILSTQSDFTVVGEAYSGVGALQQARSLQPDILLLDLAMPDISGVEVLQILQTENIPTKTIVFTAFDTDERIVGAVRAGARGYLLKGTPRNEIFHAIRVVHTGGSLLEPLVATKLLRQVIQAAPQKQEFTAREKDVLKLLAQGQPNKEIARTLGISERTVKFHVTSIMQKLGANNRTEAVTLAAQQGLVQL
jgi:two-component system, NarL family, response regulator LiaR